jgi:hypothetical protein
MTKQSYYGSKSLRERSYYQNYVDHVHADPTIDESVNFNSSSQTGTELAQPTSTSKRDYPLSDVLKLHFSQHWVEYLVGVFLFIIIFFVYDAKKDIAVINTQISYQNQQIDKLDSNTINSFQSVHTDLEKLKDSIDKNIKDKNLQDIVINEIKIRTEFIEKLINTNK